MKINLEKFKQEIVKSLEGLAFEYQWEKQIKAFCIKEGNETYLRTATEYISELFSEEEQEKFWELSQAERNKFANSLGRMYDDVWCECYEEYKINEE